MTILLENQGINVVNESNATNAFRLYHLNRGLYKVVLIDSFGVAPGRMKRFRNVYATKDYEEVIVELAKAIREIDPHQPILSFGTIYERESARRFQKMKIEHLDLTHPEGPSMTIEGIVAAMK